MAWILQLHPPPYRPSLDGMLVHHGIAHQYVAIKHEIQGLCVCVLERGGGGVGNVKQNSFLSKKIKWWNRISPLPHHPQSSVWCDDYPSTKI